MYLARELKHDRLVAVKVLHPVLMASLQGERFLREIGMLAKLAHPHILPLLDSGHDGDLLYFTMPYVDGESLRGRLRTGPLPVEESVRLVRELAQALDYAHRQGLVHRDIKPENILLADGHALLADFGIARAVSKAVDERLTSGLAPGTPHYMSPEQAGGSGDVGPRSDVYSLGCVLFELLTGRAPYLGETVQEVLRQHLFASVPSSRALRTDVPVTVEDGLRRALSKRPEDRFASAGEFARAIGATSGSWDVVPPVRSRIGRRGPQAALLAGATIAALFAAVRVSRTPEVLPWPQRVAVGLGVVRLTLDTAVFLVSPADSSRAAAAVAEQLRAALARWREVTVENATQTERAAGVDGSISAAGAERAAIALRAGRFVRVGVSRLGDSIAVTAALHDTRSRNRLGVRMLRTDDASNTETMVRRLADSLLFLTGVPADRSDGPAGTVFLAARRSYFRAHAELANGNFARAESLFAAAVDIDPGYSQALLWLANVRSWTEVPWLPNVRNLAEIAPSAWEALPGRARERASDLTVADGLLLEGLQALAARDLPAACEQWARLTQIKPYDFTSWYGLGRCTRLDHVVVRDPSQPEGWRFRSSYHATVEAFERAFRLRPSVLRGYGGRALGSLRELLFTSGVAIRQGRAAPPDSQIFSGYPVWSDDSLLVVPLAGARILAGPQSEALAEATQHQRLRFLDIAKLWKAEFPRSADAVEAYGIGLEMLGDPASMDTLERARALALDEDDRVRIAANLVLMRLKFSAPHHLSGIRQARALADSLLAAYPPSAGMEPQVLGALAAMTGRAALAAGYARAATNAAIVPALLRDGSALIAFAAHAGPADSIHALESNVSTAVLSLPSGSQPPARAAWLIRAATLAFPDVRLTSLPDTGPTGLRAGNLVASALRNDTAMVRAIAGEIAASRRPIRPADIAPDALVAEATALLHIGDAGNAIAWIDPTLQSLRFVASEDLSSSTRMAMLVRLMALRADLAARMGDRRTAAAWAACVNALWSGSDAFLQPLVRRMGELSQ